MPKLYGYCRASTTEQEDTLTIQADTIRREFDHRFAKDYEWGSCFTDRGVSGSKALRQRPEGHRLSMALEAGDAVLFTKLDRGFRNVCDLATTLESWGESKVRIILLDLNADSDTPVGRMLIQMLGAVAEFERSRIRERIKDAAAQRRREGRPVCGEAPYGQKIVGPAGKRRFVPDTYTRRIGAKILAWHLAGWSREAIYIHMLNNRIKTRLGKEWSEKAIRRAIESELRLQQEELKSGDKTGDKNAPTAPQPRPNRLPTV
jgi:DNA invertase Pin-like site-specific DNA recombinase